MGGKSEVLTAGTEAADHVLDRAVAASLEGHHARFAQKHGRAVRYESEFAPFFALEDARDPEAWDDLAQLADEGETIVLPGDRKSVV